MINSVRSSYDLIRVLLMNFFSLFAFAIEPSISFSCTSLADRNRFANLLFLPPIYGCSLYLYIFIVLAFCYQFVFFLRFYFAIFYVVFLFYVPYPHFLFDLSVSPFSTEFFFLFKDRTFSVSFLQRCYFSFFVLLFLYFPL